MGNIFSAILIFNICICSFIKIAHLFLLAGEVSLAESYLNRASSGLAATGREDLKYQFKVHMSSICLYPLVFDSFRCAILEFLRQRESSPRRPGTITIFLKRV